MEVRISRILSEYYEYTRKESEQYLREGRVTRNGQTVGIGDKATLEDEVALDGATVPLKGIFRKIERENKGKETSRAFNSDKAVDKAYAENPKSRLLRSGRKNENKHRYGKNSPDYDYEEGRDW
ncbi:MAG: hypothetical protein SOW44_07410 [Porphyromonas sp.]|nr:hypothetical protein [Bacteroidales bacterium]MDD7559638.1 hypothetical protein [Bacteroidales bacterium]MDY3101147.1 hypothetical protein [Porphyromonas sp.]